MPSRLIIRLMPACALAVAFTPIARGQAESEPPEPSAPSTQAEPAAESDGADASPESGVDDGAETTVPIAEPEPTTDETTTETPASRGQRRMPDRPVFTLRGGGAHTFRTDLDDSPGDVSITRAEAGLGVFMPVNRQVRLNGGVNAEWSWYDFSDASGLIPGTSDPLDRALITDINLTAFVAMGRKWSWFAGGRMRFAGEDGADLGDSISGGGTLAARRQFSDDFALTFGLSGTTRLEEDPLFFPFAGIEWQITEDVRLTSRGPGLELTAGLTEQLELSLSGAWEQREMRLSDTGPLPDGVFRDARVPIEVSLTWSPARNVNVRFGGGAIIWQRYRFDDSDGSEISRVNADATPFVGLRGSVRF